MTQIAPQPPPGDAAGPHPNHKIPPVNEPQANEEAFNEKRLMRIQMPAEMAKEHKASLENKVRFTATQPMRQPLKQRDKSKQCTYHRDYGYTTNDCKSLRRQVENMIVKGDLVDYLVLNEYERPREVILQKVEGNQVKVIHAIHEKLEEDQESEEVYRSRLRVVHKLRKLSSVNTITSGSISIGFGDADLSRVQLPHEDPLVISLLAVFEQLEIPSSSIWPTSSSLIGFDGTEVDPIGVINLSVTAAKRTLKENFVLTKIHPSYNLIMGRGGIHRMNGVPFILHQVMRCLSLDGKEVINLWGDQVAAKECYMLILNEAKKGIKLSKPDVVLEDTSK
ncbi:uncharacterized protein LOC132282269 [Cornus florida]|uniref:uncharacterized protein LOC132282269 n=1 Tax=Cornus florida TaxID=4283 RepID=UPI00289D8BB8|nr:uncharacterized protein LOC132282269 [Cornus florida]